ncbi:nuclear transport factor 2 family protein [Kangiella shandongensis]|uniref:nuclear transport factor 2 family protein n=1 Tax=Kangiella shandongensis TaxID=2763258 RepID=UPI001CC09F10|nr:nuclear transport factor 2 family protein [Kangiella shandongensis]
MYNDRVNNFLETLKTIPKTEDHPAPSDHFAKLFKNFHQDATEQVIREVYAEEFYFNDTFKTFHHIDQLIPYMEETAKNVETTIVEILDVSKSHSDYYLRWKMSMVFMAKGKKIESESVGMTQLRFNDDGKIILHQDYWDGAEGFYQHLPYIGYFVRKVRDSL